MAAMSEHDSLYGLLNRALDDDDVRHPVAGGSHRRIAHLEQQLASRDARIADLKNLVTVLWGAIFSLVFVWALRELLSR